MDGAGTGLVRSRHAGGEGGRAARCACILARAFVRAHRPDAPSLPDAPERLWTQGSAWISEEARRSLAFTAIQTGLALLVLTTLVRCPPDSRRRRTLLASYAVAFVSYFPGIAAVESAKLAVDDWECHTEHPNAVSGHAFYYVRRGERS